MNSIAIIGCGNIGLSIVEGLILSPEREDKIIATRRNVKKIRFLEEKGITVTSDNKLAVEQSKYIVLAVKPYIIEELLSEIKDFLREDHVLISVASEVSIETIKSKISTGTSVFRVMPNTASSIQQSMTCISYANASGKDVSEVEKIFGAIGETIIIDEDLMEAATILGACGIAYVLRFIRAMIQGGIQIGFDANTASKITTQTVKGAAELLLQKNAHPESEIDKVTTPKGCTITGLNEMEHQGFSSSLIKGITKSFEKIES